MQVFFKNPLTNRAPCAILCENFRKDTAMTAYMILNNLYTVEKRGVETMDWAPSGLCRCTHFSGSVLPVTGV